MAVKSSGNANFKIPRHKTAMNFGSPSVAVVYALKAKLISSVVYDFGCGRGRDTRFLREEGYEVISYDPFYEPVNEPKNVNFSKVTTILINYVFNVIEDIEERKKVLQNLVELAAEKTIFVISVRSKSEIDACAEKSVWKTLNDGYITPIGTFQHGYTPVELKKFVSENLNVLHLEDRGKGGIFAICIKDYF